MKRNIVLVGFMGSGKSSVGRLVADRLGWKFIDTDEEVEKCTGLTIREIFDRYGEPEFRKLEKREVARAAKFWPAVIATGGGAMLDEENVKALSETGWLIWLKVSPEAVLERIRDASSRPLLSRERESLASFLEERERRYRLADVAIETSGRGIEEVAEQIISFVRENCRGEERWEG